MVRFVKASAEAIAPSGTGIKKGGHVGSETLHMERQLRRGYQYEAYHLGSTCLGNTNTVNDGTVHRTLAGFLHLKLFFILFLDLLCAELQVFHV